MTFFEKCTVIILVYHQDAKRFNKNSPNVTYLANGEAGIYTRAWSCFEVSRQCWSKKKKKKKAVLLFLLFCVGCHVTGVPARFQSQFRRLFSLRFLPHASSALCTAGLDPAGCTPDPPPSLGFQVSSAHRGALGRCGLSSMVLDPTWSLLSGTPALCLLLLTPPSYRS